MTDASPFDPQALRQLQAINPEDGGEFLREIVAIFLADTPQRLLEVRQALDGGDPLLLIRAAHSIKGSAGNFGAKPLAVLAEELEQLAKASDFRAGRVLLPTLEAEFDRLRLALDKWVVAV